MNCDNILAMISEYLDNELSKENEGYLFTHLASCKSCREELKRQSLFQNNLLLQQKEIRERQEERIFNSILKRENSITPPSSKIRFVNWVTYAAAFTLLLAAVYFSSQASNYQKRLEKESIKIEEQGELIRILFDSLPIDENSLNVQKPIIVSAKRGGKV